MFIPRPRYRVLFASLVLALLSTACGIQAGGAPPSSTGQGGSSSATSADFLVSATSAEYLFAFSAVLDEVRLIRVDGTYTENFLAGEIEVEFVHLDEELFWLARDAVPSGSYESLLLSFVPGTYAATGNDGTRLSIDATSDELVADLPRVAKLEGEPYRRFVINLNLQSSLSRGPEEGTLTFDPEGLAGESDGLLPAPLDGVMGIVRRRETGTGQMEVDVYADQLLEVPIARVEVDVPQTSLLVNNNNFVLQQVPYFFTFLIPGSTIVDLHGTLGGEGIVRTSRVEIEDQVPIVGQVFPVKLEGRIYSFLSDTVFEFELRNIERGKDLVEGYLDLLGNPRFIDVQIAPQLNLYFVDGNRLADASELGVGLEVSIKFSSFSAEPYQAFRMELADPYAGFRGAVTDVSNLPDSFEMRLFPGEPAITGGLVDSTQTDVTVFLLGGELYLNTFDRQSIEPEQLVEGGVVGVRGTLWGPSSAPNIGADRIGVFPGQLEQAQVFGILPANSSFQTSGGLISFPFGSDLGTGLPGALRIFLAEDATFRGAAIDEESFFNRFETLQPGENLWVDVAGIATERQHEIVAYEIVSGL